MKRLDDFSKYILRGENKNALAFLKSVSDSLPCPEYEAAFIKVFLVETAKHLNKTVGGFYYDANELVQLLCRKDAPPSWEEIIAKMCNKMKSAHIANKKDIVEKAKSYICENLTDNQLTIGETAAFSGVSQSVLCKLFAENMKMTPGEYIGKLRVDKSIALLSALSIKATAKKVGFSSVESFIRTFKKHMGETPGRWKRNNLFL